MAVYVNTIVCTIYKCSEFGQFLIILHIPVKKVQSKKDDRGNIQEIFIDTYSFLLVKAHRNHNKFLTKMLTFFLHSEVTQDTSLFHRYHPGTLISHTM